MLYAIAIIAALAFQVHVGQLNKEVDNQTSTYTQLAATKLIAA